MLLNQNYVDKLLGIFLISVLFFSGKYWFSTWISKVFFNNIRRLLNWSLVVTVGCDAKSIEIEKNCITATMKSAGMCVPVRNCVSIMQLLTNGDHISNPEISEFLRRSQCGKKIDSHDVCCELTDVDFGPVNELEGPVTTHFYGESIWGFGGFDTQLYFKNR